MILWLVLSIVTAFILGYLMVWRLWPGPLRPAMLIAVLALPAGWSLTSAGYFFWLILSGGRSHWYLVAEVVVLILALAFALRHNRHLKIPIFSGFSLDRSTLFSMPPLLAVAGLFFTISIKIAAANPWGYWDAWARINMKARFLFAGGDQWTWIFGNSNISHSDYPLLISASIARTWTWIGEITLLSPQVISIVWGVWLVIVLYSLVAWLRGQIIALMVAFAYLTFTPLLFWTSAQYSDIPLACYMMISCSLVVAVEKFADKAKHFALLAGFFTGSAAWCKNEGVMFLLLVVIWWLILFFRGYLPERLKVTGWFLVGLGIVGSATLILKGAYAGQTDLSAGHSSLQSVAASLVDGKRHLIILEKLLQYLDGLWSGWSLLPLAMAFSLHHFWNRHRIAHVGPLVCVISLAAVYYLVFVTTHHDLHWHLRTALDRLILQLWPVFLLALAVFFEEHKGAR